MDFEFYKKKFTSLTIEDFEKIKLFLNLPNIKEQLIKIEQQRKNYLKNINLSLVGIVFIGLLIIFLLGIPEFIFFLVFIGIIIVGFIYSYYQKKLKLNIINNEIIKNIMSIVDKNILYSKDSFYFTESIDEVKNITGNFIQRYDRIDLMEDSISYKTGKNIDDETKTSINMMGLEFKSSYKTTDSKGNTQRHTADRSYLYKVTFDNHRFELKSFVKLSNDMTLFNKISKIIYFLFLIVILFLTIYQFNYTFFIILIILLIIGYFLFMHKSNQIKLENLEFEKIFDVYSNDPIEARRLLTPSFMHRLVIFSKSISKNNLYNFYFDKNYIYIKRKLNGGYLEFSLLKSITDDYSSFIEFFIHTKQTVGLIKDLNLYYYDIGSFSNEIK